MDTVVQDLLWKLQTILLYKRGKREEGRKGGEGEEKGEEGKKRGKFEYYTCNMREMPNLAELD